MTDDGRQVWLVRHGETEWSRSGQHTSTTELDLTEEGLAVASKLGERLSSARFGLVLTSPRKRARVTAELAGFPDAEVDEDLAEWAYGDYEGITTDEIRKTVPDWTVWTHPTPGGETAQQVTERLDRVIARCQGFDGDVLLFAHGHSLRALAARWIQQTVNEGRYLALDTATIGVLGWYRAIPVIVRWNS